VAALHDFAEEVAQVVPRNLFVHVQVVAHDVAADGEIAVVEGVHPRPALRAEFLARQDEGVEGAESEEDGLVLELLRALFDACLAEEPVRAQHVTLDVLRCFVGDLERVLQDGLGDDLHPRQWRCFAGEEATELLVRGRRDLVELEFEHTGPRGHQVDVVERDPVAVLCSLHERLVCAFLLSLPHGDLNQRVVGNAFVLLLSNVADVGGRLDSREEHEEERDAAVALQHGVGHVEWRFVSLAYPAALGVVAVHFSLHLVFQRELHPV